MKSIINKMFLLLLLGVGGLFAYGYYYQDSTIIERQAKTPVAYVEIEREVISEPIVVEEVAEIEEVVEAEEPEEVVIEEELVEEVVLVEEPVVIEEELEVVVAVVEAPVKAKKISIIITDVSNENIDSVIKYFADDSYYIGLAFSYGSYDAMKKAREAGFNEIIASVTMEPFNESIDLPASTIKVGNTHEENIRILDTVLGETYMPIAIMNKMGSKVTSKKHIDTLNPIMDELKVKKLGFVDSKSNYYSIAGDIAEVYGVAYAENYMYFDRDLSSNTAMLDSLDKIKERADYQDYVLAMGDYSSEMVKVLDIWLAGLNTDNMYELVPVSVLMK